MGENIKRCVCASVRAVPDDEPFERYAQCGLTRRRDAANRHAAARMLRARSLAIFITRAYTHAICVGGGMQKQVEHQGTSKKPLKETYSLLFYNYHELYNKTLIIK